MNNPYTSERMRRWKYQQVLLYRAGLVVLFPKLVVWKLDASLADYSWWGSFRRVVLWVTFPFRSCWAFFKFWLVTRPWSSLWLAAPVLVILLLVVAVSLIRMTRGGGVGEFASYYASAMQAFRDGDVKKADHYFGKIIDHEKYRDMDEVLLKALIAAGRSGNKAQATQLYQTLVVQRDYVPAKRWVVSEYLKRGNMAPKQVGEYVSLCRKMAESSTVEGEDFWRRSWAELLLKEGLRREAVAVLGSYDSRSPESSWLLVTLYKELREKEKAIEEAKAMITKIELVDPGLNQYLNEHIKGLLIQSDYTLLHDDSVTLIRKAVLQVEQKRLEVDRVRYSVMLGRLYVILSKKLIEYYSDPERLNAFQYLDKAIELDPIPEKIGATLFGILNSNSEYYMTPDQIQKIRSEQPGIAVDLLTGIAAWNAGDVSAAKLHVKGAAKLNLKAYEAVRFYAVELAKGDRADSVKRAFQFQDFIVTLNPRAELDIQLDRCRVFAARSSWQEIVDLIEPRMDALERRKLIEASRWMVRAYRSLGNEVKAKEYERIQYDEMLKLKR